MIELATAPAATLHFMTVAELREQTPARPAWLWDTYIAAGNLTLLIGKPKAGKTTLALGLATALATGADSFLGCDVHAAPVIYISEEAGGTLLHKRPDDGARMHILTRDSAWPKPDWPRLVAAAVTQARKTTARLLVIDTASFWMALAADRGKDAGAVQAAMMPLVQATREGLAVVLVHRSRKAAGEDGDAALGSTAWVFSVDTILEVERPPDENAPPTQRLLIGLGRHPSTPPCALIDLDCSHRCVGDVPPVQHTRVELHFHLLPDVDDGPKTLDEALALARLAVADGTGLVTCAPHVHLIDVSSVPERVAALAGALRPARIPLQVTPGGELRPGTRPTDARSLRSSRTARPIHVARSLCHLSCDRGRAGVRLLGSTSTYIRAVPHNRLSGNTANPFWAFWPTEVAPKRSRIWSARRG